MPRVSRLIWLGAALSLGVGLVSPPAASAAPAASSTVTPAVPAATPPDQSASASSPARTSPRALPASARPTPPSTDGTCPRELPTGASVARPGPAGTTFIGTGSCARGLWTLRVTGGTGTVGGMALASRDFRGTLTSRDGRVAGRVTISLSSHPQLVPEWRQTSFVAVRPTNPGWRSTVVVGARSDSSARLALSGPLHDDGTYELRGGGSVAFAGTRVDISGWYRSPGMLVRVSSLGAVRRTSAPTWNLVGGGRDGAIAGAVITRPSITMTQARPGVTGRADLRMAFGPRLVSTGALHIVNAGQWDLSPRGSSSSRWSPPHSAGVTVDTTALGGWVGMRQGRLRWAVTAPFATTASSLRISGILTVAGRDTFRLRATGATGTILGEGVTRLFTGGADSITLTRATVRGHLSLVTNQTRLVSLPDGWTTTTTFTVTPRELGAGWRLSYRVQHQMRNGASSLRLIGSLPSTGGFALTASGALVMGGSPIPFHGYFHSKGYLVGGVPLAKPEWSMSGSLAQGGGVRLHGGARIASGTIGFTGGHGAPAEAQRPVAGQATVTPTSVSGQGLLQLASNSSFLLPVTYTYTDQNNWTVTAAGTTPGNTFNPFTGLAIPETAFHGTATDVNGTQTWNVTIDSVTWSGMAKGIISTGSMTLSNTCPLHQHCPSTAGIFFGGSSTLEFDNGLPTVSAAGAFLADGSWARWDGSSDTVSWKDISVVSPTLTIWKGPRDDTGTALVMPDLSGINGNGLGVEYCGTYQVTIPDVTTSNTSGCVEWSKDGVVIGQVNTGGSVSQGSHNGINLHGTTLTGFAWSDLVDAPKITLNGQTLTLDKGRSYITASLGIPGTVMHDVGAGTSKDTTIPAQGWFDSSGDFSLDGYIPVNMKSSGFTLQDISVHIGKSGHDFTLSMGADCTVAINGNHFPLSVYIGYEKETDTTITVRLNAHGMPNASPSGSMDYASLLPAGDFEPVTTSLVDGSFDATQRTSDVKDGGFENASAQGNLVANSGFEDGLGAQLIPNEGFEDGTSRNLLANAGSEDRDVLYNGDFESNDGSSTVGWTQTGSYTVTLIKDTASGAAESGTYAASITNIASSGSQDTGGAWQTISWAAPAGTSLTLSGWVRGDTTTKVPFTAYLLQTGCTSGTYTTSSSTLQVDSTTWQQSTLTTTAQAGCTGMVVYLDPNNAKTTAVVDAWSLTVGTPTWAAALPNVYAPHVLGRFDSLDSTPLASRTSGVSIATDYPGTLRTNGCQNGFMFSGSSYGYTPGDFDMSVKVLFPSGSNQRDVADIGFWMNPSGSSYSGYMFRVVTGNNDGGFRSTATSTFLIPTATMPNLLRDVWYQVRITAVGNVLTAFVTRLDTNAQVYVQTVYAPALLPHSGAFGQIPSGACSTEGSRWDDLAVYTASSGSQVRIDPANAHSGSASTVLKGSVGNWSAEYSSGEAPEQGTQFSYSAWVRSTGGRVSGTLALSATGGTPEVATQAFTATSTWQQVAVTLRMNNAGHTDLRPGFLNMTTSGIELQVDDQVLQQVPWRTYPDSPNALTEFLSTDAHSGSASMALIDRNGGSTAMFEFPSNSTVAGTVYAFSAWIKSSSPVTGTIRLGEGSSSSPTSTSFAATSTWTQVSVIRGATNGTTPYVAIDLGPNQQGVPLLVDDVSLTLTKYDAAWNATALGAPPKPAAWLADGGFVRPVVGGAAHTGAGALRINPGPYNGYAAYYDVSASPAVGSSWTASVWLYSGANGGVSSMVRLSDGADETYKSITANSSWQQVTLTLPVRTAGSTGFRIWVQNGSKTGQTLLVDDVSLALQGLAPVDPWQAVDNGAYTSYAVLSDPSQAASGSNFIEVAEHGGNGGSLLMDAAYKPTAGTAHELAFMARSASGASTTVTGRIITLNGSGTALNQRAVSFNVGTDWNQQYLSLPITNTSATTIRVEFDIPKNAVVDLDDITSRDIAGWSTVGSGTTAIDAWVNTTAGVPANGPGALSFTAGGAGVGVGAATSQQVSPGLVYTLDAYVRSTTGTAGTLKLVSSGLSTETASAAFTGTGAWQEVKLTFTATKSNTALTAQVLARGAGAIDVDTLTLIPSAFNQRDPWTRTSPSVTFGVYDDPSRAHDGSYGLLEMSTTAANTGVQHTITQTTSVGDIYNASAWVRSPTGKAVKGVLKLSTGGGPSASQSFTATNQWQLVALRLPITASSQAGLTAALLLSTTGITLDVDDVMVQRNPWVAVSDAGGTATQTVITDGASAQSGTGYLRLLNTGSAGGDAYLDTAGTYSSGQTWTATVYVRSSSGTAVNGVLSLGAVGGTRATQAFTAGHAWTAVSVAYPLTSSPASLRTDVRVAANGLGLDIDSAALDNGTPPPDGVTTPLPHPSTGWTYLWDDAFGIPGSHLWSITAQVQFVGGKPGLGVGATLYHDPTKSPNLMTGTDWIKGDMALNVSKADPCFSFDFASTGDSKVSVAGGVFTASDFSINFAPRGCAVGAYVVPRGASVSFDGGLGSATVHFDMSLTTGADGPEFTEHVSVTNLVLGGVTYNNVALALDLSATKSSVSMAADMILPMGNFAGMFALSVSTSQLHMEGDVSVTNWTMAGGGFSVQAFTYHQSLDIAFGPGACATIEADTTGYLMMAKRTKLAFDGLLEVRCGRLAVLHFDYDYRHGSITQKFNLDYNASTHLLAGGSYFAFERSTSWKLFGHRYHRHPYITLGLTFSMDTTKPGSGSATLEGNVSVSGGDGELKCQINGDGQDDYCHIHVHIDVFGKHTFDDEW